MAAAEDFADFVHARWHQLVRSGMALGCSPEDAHDLAQTTLLRCYLKWNRVQHADSPDAYVYQILLNCFRDQRRRRWTGEYPTEELPEQPIPDASSQVVQSDAVRRALANLSPDHREVVVLRFLANLDVSETAALLGIPIGTVKSRLSRAVDQLAQCPQLATTRQEYSA